MGFSLREREMVLPGGMLADIALVSGGGGITAEPQSRRHLMEQGHVHVAENIWRDLTV